MYIHVCTIIYTQICLYVYVYLISIYIYLKYMIFIENDVNKLLCKIKLYKNLYKY